MYVLVRGLLLSLTALSKAGTHPAVILYISMHCVKPVFNPNIKHESSLRYVSFHHYSSSEGRDEEIQQEQITHRTSPLDCFSQIL